MSERTVSPQPTKSPTTIAIRVRWRATGSNQEDRTGYLDGAPGTVHIDRQKGGKYAVRYAGEIRAHDIQSLDAAKKIAADNITTWAVMREERRRAHEDAGRKAREESLAKQERAKEVASKLLELGVAVHADLETIKLEPHAAEHLIARLEALRTIGSQGPRG